MAHKCMYVVSFVFHITNAKLSQVEITLSSSNNMELLLIPTSLLLFCGFLFFGGVFFGVFFLFVCLLFLVIVYLV